MKPYPLNIDYKGPEVLKALIIDDETDICYLLSNILKKRNIQATIVGTLTEARKLLDSQKDFSLIFLDNHLPDGFGISMIDSFKQKIPEARLVMITAHDTTTDKQSAVSNGADYFIGKPFSTDIILNTVDKFTA